MKKETFVLNADLYDKTISLSNEEVGAIFRKMLLYVKGEETPILSEKLELIFDFIKFDIDKNSKKYEEKCKRNKENGSLGGAPRGNKNAQKNSTDDSDLLDEIEDEEKKTTENNPKQPKQPKTTETTENNMIYHNHSHIHNQEEENSKDKGMGEEEEEEETEISFTKQCKQIIEHLNNKTKSKYKYTTKATQSRIKARLNEGFKLDDFIVVIDKKVDEWIGTEFEMYLCPETLFGTKFEKYLNQPKKVRKQPEAPKEPKWFNQEFENKELTEEESEEFDKIFSDLVGE